MNRPVPDLFVEQLALGDLPPERAAEVREALEASGQLHRLDEITASDAAVLKDFPAETVMPAVRLRARAVKQARWVTGFALAAAALLAVGVIPVALQGPPSEETRLKGQVPSLQVHRLEGDGAVRLEAGDAVVAGDLVQLSYAAASGRYGVIVSIDGRGAVTVHTPESGAQAIQLARGGVHPLDQSYELDDAPAFERFFFVTGRRPFDVGQVRLAAERLAAGTHPSEGALDLPTTLSVESFLLRKGQP